LCIKAFKDVILFQNSASIYWKLAKQELEQQVEVVQVNDRAFCLMTTPPIVCQQSYLNWLEHEEGEIDYSDSRASFIDIVGIICDFLDIDLGDRGEDVEVFTCGDLSFLDRLKEDKVFSQNDLREIKRQILASESYYIPGRHYIYLANVSINHAAEEAAHFIKHICSGQEQPRILVDAFYAKILHEALGFFGSKIINHKRKAPSEANLRHILVGKGNKNLNRDDEVTKKIANFVLLHKQMERGFQDENWEEIFYQTTDVFLGVTTTLGYMLGDRLYYGMLQGFISKEDIRELFYDPFLGDHGAYLYYLTLILRLQRVRIPRRA
jgi:hypothetical protein